MVDKKFTEYSKADLLLLLPTVLKHLSIDDKIWDEANQEEKDTLFVEAIKKEIESSQNKEEALKNAQARISFYNALYSSVTEDEKITRELIQETNAPEKIVSNSSDIENQLKINSGPIGIPIERAARGQNALIQEINEKFKPFWDSLQSSKNREKTLRAYKALLNNMRNMLLKVDKEKWKGFQKTLGSIDLPEKEKWLPDLEKWKTTKQENAYTIRNDIVAYQAVFGQQIHQLEQNARKEKDLKRVDSENTSKLRKQESVLPSLATEEQFNAFCNEVEQMCKGLANKTHKDFTRRTTSNFDFILEASYPSSTIAAAIAEAFKPAATQTRQGGLTGNQIIVEFKVNEVKQTDPLLTPEGRKDAHSKIFAILEKNIDVMNEKGQPNECLDKAAKDTQKNTDEIKSIIKLHIEEFKKQFNEKPLYTEKNKVLIELRQFYDKTRDEKELITLVNEWASKNDNKVDVSDENIPINQELDQLINKDDEEYQITIENNSKNNDENNEKNQSIPIKPPVITFNDLSQALAAIDMPLTWFQRIGLSSLPSFRDVKIEATEKKNKISLSSQQQQKGKKETAVAAEKIDVINQAVEYIKKSYEKKPPSTIWSQAASLLVTAFRGNSAQPETATSNNKATTGTTSTSFFSRLNSLFRSSKASPETKDNNVSPNATVATSPSIFKQIISFFKPNLTDEKYGKDVSQTLKEPLLNKQFIVGDKLNDEANNKTYTPPILPNAQPTNAQPNVSSDPTDGFTVLNVTKGTVKVSNEDKEVLVSITGTNHPIEKVTSTDHFINQGQKYGNKSRTKKTVSFAETHTIIPEVKVEVSIESKEKLRKHFVSAAYKVITLNALVRADLKSNLGNDIASKYTLEKDKIQHNTLMRKTTIAHIYDKIPLPAVSMDRDNKVTSSVPKASDPDRETRMKIVAEVMVANYIERGGDIKKMPTIECKNETMKKLVEEIVKREQKTLGAAAQTVLDPIANSSSNETVTSVKNFNDTTNDDDKKMGM